MLRLYLHPDCLLLRRVSSPRLRVAAAPTTSLLSVCFVSTAAAFVCCCGSHPQARTRWVRRMRLPANGVLLRRVRHHSNGRACVFVPVDSSFDDSCRLLRLCGRLSHFRFLRRGCNFGFMVDFYFEFGEALFKLLCFIGSRFFVILALCALCRLNSLLGDVLFL